MATGSTAEIDVQTETATAGGWSYQVVLVIGQRSSTHTVTLSWHDHDYWCGGALPPSRLLERLLAIVAANLGQGRTPATLPARFDCATARRWLPELDDLLRQGSACGGVNLPG
ncbi:MAG: hypothetical protein KatS3mg103_0675 [Phycisphaerales bacterium]|nr:MAG: hypothetical protein KatS3mg103_0675 [Phycisphaerales bacterium]